MAAEPPSLRVLGVACRCEILLSSLKSAARLFASAGFFFWLPSVATFPVQDPPSPVIWMASQMHHGNDLDEAISDPIDPSVREAMNKVSPDIAVFVYKRPGPGRFPYCLNGSINFNEEFRSEVVCSCFVPYTGMLQLSIHIGMYVNAVHRRFGRVDL